MAAMDWKNQLTKTPYLVLFIVLISIGVGTASAIITITLDGHVVFPESVHVASNLLDESGDSGATGQVLSSTPTGVDWITSSGSGTLTVVHRESNTVNIASGQSAIISASCLQGEVVTGGGFENTSLSGAPIIDFDGPKVTTNVVTGWSVNIFNDGIASMTAKVFVMCAKLTP